MMVLVLLPTKWLPSVAGPVAGPVVHFISVFDILRLGFDEGGLRATSVDLSSYRSFPNI